MKSLFTLLFAVIFLQACNCIYKKDSCPQAQLVPNYSAAFYGFTKDELSGTVFLSYEPNKGFANSVDSMVIDSTNNMLTKEGDHYIVYNIPQYYDWKIELRKFGRTYTIDNKKQKQVFCHSCFGKKEYTYEPDGFDFNGQHQTDYQVRIDK